MRYMLLVYNDPEKIQAMTDEDLTSHIGKCGAWVAEMAAAGRDPLCGALQSVRTAATVRVRDGNVTVTDGPFAETKEVLAGFTIMEARDLSEAVQLAANLDVARVNTVEVRPMMDPGIEPADPLDQRIIGIVDQLHPER